MKNKKLLTQTIGKVSTAVDAKDGNLIIEIPIIQTLDEEPIQISAIYNSNNPGSIGPFGLKTKLNYHKEFYNDGNKYIATDAYGNEEEYELQNNEYINPQNLTKLSVITTTYSDDSEESTFILTDKYNNQIKYNELSAFPLELKSNGDLLMSGSFEDGIAFYKPNGEKVTLNSSSKCTQASYYKDGTEETYSTSLVYDTQNRITKVTDSLGEVHEFEYGSDYIKIKYSPTNSYLKFTFTNNKVSKVESGVLRGSLTPNELLFTYFSDYTKLTAKEPTTQLNQYFEHSSYVFFDEDGNLSFEFDELGNGYKLEYNNSNNISFEGNVLNLKTTKNNLILDDDETQVGGQALPAPFNLLGDEQYPLNGMLIYQTENVKSKENTLSFFAKGSGTLNVYINDTSLETIQLKNKYTLYQLRVSCSNLNEAVTIKLSGQAYICGVKLQSGLAGGKYEYDANKNIRKVITGSDEVVYIYSIENKLLQIKENGKVVKKITYEKNKVNAYNNYTMDVVTEEGLYNNKQICMTGVGVDENYKITNTQYLDNTYNTINLVEKQGINKYITKTKNENSQSFGLITEEEITHNIVDNTLQKTEKKCSYVLDKEKKESKNVYVDGKLSYHQTYIKSGQYIDKYLKNSLHTYNSVNKYLKKSVSSLNNPVTNLNDATYSNIRYEYYDNELLKAVYVDDKLVEKFEYFPNTSLIRYHQFSYKDAYGYTYDSKNRITGISIYNISIRENEDFGDDFGMVDGSITDNYDIIYDFIDTHQGYTFVYNEDNMLANVYKKNGEVLTLIEEYIYEDGVLKEIKNGSFENKILFDGITSNGYTSHSNGTDRVISRSQDDVDYHKRLEVGDEPTFLDSDDKTISYSSTTYYNSNKELNDKYELYPLHKSFVSLKGNRPISFPNITNDDIFEFDIDSHKKVYNSKNKQVTFETDYNEGLSFMFKVKVLDSNFELKLLKLKFNNNDIEVIKTSTGNIKFKFNNILYSTSLSLNDNLWHRFGIRLSEYTQYDSEDTEYCYLGFDMVLDDVRYGIGIENYEVIDKFKVILGDNKDVSIRYEMLATGVSDSLQELKSDYETLNKVTTKVETYSSAGLLIREQVFDEDTLILNKKYTYYYDPNITYGLNIFGYHFFRRDRVDIGSFLLKSEDYGISDFDSEYIYDSEGRIKTVNVNSEETTFGYDDLGRLNGIEKEAYKIEWKYDDHGNPSLANGLIESFDQNNRIMNVKSEIAPTNVEYSVSYDLHNMFLPTSYNGNTLEFECNKLIKFENGKYIVTFEYNHNGLRSTKTVFNKITNLIKTHNFFYDNANLIREEISEGDNLQTFDFLYDSKGELFGFETSTGDRYYYVRDSFKNIKGIIDKNGLVVVKYKYNSHGVASVTGNKLLYNPFRYKGYYYDDETQLFYCNSRYYSPELCRFISPDSIEYLDPQSINGLNLYCYCMNNPIMYADPSGHMPEWLQWTLGGLIVVGAIALSICTAGLATPIATAVGGGLFGAIVGGAVAGAIGGAIAGFGVSIGTQAITNGFKNINWSDVGKSTASGAISGFIAGGVFGGIKYAYSAKSLANSVSGLSKAQSSLDNAWKPLSNVKNLANMPFSGANIATTVGQAAANYNAAYTNLIFAGVNNTIAKLAFTGLYAGAQFGLKQLIGYGINQIW